VIALSHARLREAIAAALGSSGVVSVVGTAGNLDEAIQTTHEVQPDGVLVGAGLLQGDAASDLRRLSAAIPDVRIVVVGTDPNASYGAALKRAGAADYVALGGIDAVISAVTSAIPGDASAEG
jgi:DNA-binding NarL/FixJ family response regulator